LKKHYSLMINSAKEIIKFCFRIINIDIRRIPEYKKNKFVWLKDLNINTVMDVGANVGQFALEISKVLPNARIYSFEALRSVYGELLKNSKEIKNFKAINVALGNFSGTTKIYRNKYSPSSSVLEMADLHKKVFPHTKETYEGKVVVRRLDDIITEEKLELKPNTLIKLDVQGYEDKVIQGGIGTFKKATVIITEVSFYELYKGQPLFDQIQSQLRKMGFECKGSINASFHPETGLPLFADAIFVME